MNKIEVSLSELESLRSKIKRAKTTVSLLWLSLGSNPSPELLEDAMMQISDDFADASGILAKFDA